MAKVAPFLKEKKARKTYKRYRAVLGPVHIQEPWASGLALDDDKAVAGLIHRLRTAKMIRVDEVKVVRRKKVEYEEVTE